MCRAQQGLAAGLMNRTLALTAITGLNIAVGLAAQLVMLLYFGASVATDAHIASLTLPLLVNSLLIPTLPQVLVPLLVEAGGDRRLSWQLFWPGAAILTAAAALLHASAPVWVPGLFWGMTDDTVALAINLTRIQIWTIPLGALAAIPLAHARAHNRLVLPEVLFLLATLTSLVLLVIVIGRWGIIGASLALLARPAIQLVSLLTVLGAPTLNGASGAFYRDFWQRVKPLLIGAPIYKLGPVVDRVIASFAAPGQLSLLVYGQQLWGMGITMLDRTQATPFLSAAAHDLRTREKSAVLTDYRQRLNRVAVLTACCVALFWLVGEWLFELVATHTRLEAADARQLWVVALVLGGTLIAGGMGQLSAAGMYCVGDTRGITRVAVGSFLFATIVKITLFLTWGIVGVAVGCVCYQLINHVFLHRRFRAAMA